MLATARTFSLIGISAREVAVEVDVRRGLGSFAIVGLPDRAVRESRERVRAALSNAGFEFPLQRITVNLAPASVVKEGPGFDLAIAAGLLGASGQLPPDGLDGCALAGELSLDGSVRPVPGILPMAERAAHVRVATFAVAEDNVAEASLAAAYRGSGLRVVPLRRLAELREVRRRAEEAPPPGELDLAPAPDRASLPDLAELRGQPALRRALEIAAAGGHGLLIIGPPGAGKSLAARRVPSILPPLELAEAIEVLRVASVCGAGVDGSLRRPFRAPHHTVSATGLVGGGSPPRPGEVTLAHRGVLFLDELGEFARAALEALRQPMEEGRVVIVRSHRRVELPCRFMLVAAANPCPCGRGDSDGDCSCNPVQARRYMAKLSGALADRIDLVLGVEQPSAEALAGPPEESSAAVRERVVAARARQSRRLGGRANAEMTVVETRRHCRPSHSARRLLAASHTTLGLSGRSHDRILRVARTIADLAGADEIDEAHVGEALSLRRRRRT